MPLTPLQRPATRSPPVIAEDTAAQSLSASPAPHKAAKQRYRGKDWQRAQMRTVRLRFSGLYSYMHNKVLCRRVGCKRGLMIAWLQGQVPLHGLRALLAVVEADLVVLRGLQADLRKLVADREMEPKRLGGMFRVKDWGDGLPPHAKVHRGGGQGKKRLVVDEDGSTESVFVGKAEP